MDRASVWISPNPHCFPRGARGFARKFPPRRRALSVRPTAVADEIVNHPWRVGRRSGFGVTEPTAETDDGTPQSGDPKAPAANVHGVNVVVPQLAVARVPEPMPVVMKLRPCQRTHRRRARE